MTSNGNGAKLVLVGVGAMLLFSEFGPMGIIMLGVVLLMIAK